MANYSNSAIVYSTANYPQWTIVLNINTSQSDKTLNCSYDGHINNKISQRAGSFSWSVSGATSNSGSLELSGSSTNTQICSGNFSVNLNENSETPISLTLSTTADFDGRSGSVTVSFNGPKLPPSITVPSAVSNLKVFEYDRDNKTVTITWTNTASGTGTPTNIKVEYQNVISGASKTSYDVSNGTTSYTFTDIAPSSQYYFAVTPSNSAGTGDTKSIYYTTDIEDLEWANPDHPLTVFMYGYDDAYEIHASIKPPSVLVTEVIWGIQTNSDMVRSVKSLPSGKTSCIVSSQDEYFDTETYGSGLTKRWCKDAYNKSSQVYLQVRAYYNKYDADGNKTRTLAGSLETTAENATAINIPIAYVRIPDGAKYESFMIQVPDDTKGE